jgi:hypothetical protein
LLHQIRRGLIDVSVARQELRCQAEALQDRLALVPLAPPLKAACFAELAILDTQLTEVAEGEQALTLIDVELDRQAESWQTHGVASPDGRSGAENQPQTVDSPPVSAEITWRPALEQVLILIQQADSRLRALQARVDASF